MGRLLLRLLAPITVVHRADGSGTSYVLTDYLSKVSPEWQSTVGRGTDVRWPVGLGAPGNEGVADLVQHTENAIGYVELIYSVQHDLPYAGIRNRAGNFVLPSLESVNAAAAAVATDLPHDFRVSITDGTGPDAYPISSFTWLLVPARLAHADKGLTSESRAPSPGWRSSTSISSSLPICSSASSDHPD